MTTTSETAQWHAYKVQLGDVLDPHADYPSRRLRTHVGADHTADQAGDCHRCGCPWPCVPAVELGRMQGLEPPAGWTP